jgi:hypothetical protein
MTLPATLTSTPVPLESKHISNGGVGLLDDDLDSAHLVFLIIAVAAWWQAVPQLARMLTGADGADPAEHTRRRTCVVRAAQRLALAPGSINPLPGSGHGR